MTVRAATWVWSVLVAVLGLVVDVVAAILLVAVAVVLGIIGGLAMICTAVYLHGRDIGVATRNVFRRTPKTAEAPTVTVDESAVVPPPVELPMVELLDRKAVLESQIGVSANDPALLGHQAFLEFLLANPWAVLPDEEKRAWAAVSKNIRNGQKTAMRKGFVAERDLWAANLGLANHQAA